MTLFETIVLIRGAGDLGTGVAYRLYKAGFPVVMTELAAPLMVRTTVSYGSAVPYDTVVVEGITARRSTVDEILERLASGVIPVVVDSAKTTLERLRPPVVIDARIAKNKLDTTINDATLVIALGPGFVAGVDCHAVIETNRGHSLGRVIWQGSAEPDTGMPAPVNGKTEERVLRAPQDGELRQVVNIGDFVKQGDVIARVDGAPIIAAFDGIVRGLLDTPMRVTAGIKVGDLDPRAKREHCFTISDKSLAIGGGAVEAVLSAPQLQPLLARRTRG